MGQALAISRDTYAVSTLQRFFDSFSIEFQHVGTIPSAIRALNNADIDFIVIDTDIPTLTPVESVSELDEIADRKKKDRPMVVFISSRAQSLPRNELMARSRTTIVDKPIQLERLYNLVSIAGLLDLTIPDEWEETTKKIAAFEAFIQQSQAWLGKLKERLVRS